VIVKDTLKVVPAIEISGLLSSVAGLAIEIYIAWGVV